MGEPAGKMVDLLVSEESSRIILIALAVFVLAFAILIGVAIYLYKVVNSIRANSKTEFEEEREQNEYREKVTDTQDDLKYLSDLMVRLTETVNASNTQLSNDIKKLNENMTDVHAGCAYGHELEKEINHIKDDVLVALKTNVDLLLDSDKESIKAYITKEYQYWMNQGFIDIYSLNVLDERFRKYTKEKGNTFVADMVKELHNLPHRAAATNCTTPRMIEEKERNEVLPSEYFHQKEAMNATIISVEDPKEDEND